MNKRLKWAIAALSVAGVLALGVGAAAASAAGPAASNGAQTSCVQQNGGGLRFQGGCLDEVTTLLGMTEQEIQAQRQEGKSLVQIAATEDVTEAQLVEAIMAGKRAAIQEKVAAGTLTQEQANVMLAAMEQNTVQATNRTSTGPFGGQGNGVCNGTGDCDGTGKGNMNRQGNGQCGAGASAGTVPGGMSRGGRGSR